MDARHLAAFKRRRLALIEKARLAAFRANSYRGFKVGCAVLGWNGHAYEIFLGANMKPVDGGVKVCAEPQAIGAARASGCDLIVAIVVSGKPQEDHGSGYRPPTLHPCEACRFLMRNTPEIEDDTIILTVCNSTGPEEEMFFLKLWELHRFHQGGRGSQASVDSGTREWAAGSLRDRD